MYFAHLTFPIENIGSQNDMTKTSKFCCSYSFSYVRFHGLIFKKLHHMAGYAQSTCISEVCAQI